MLGALACIACLAAAPGTYGDQLGAHSMIYLNSPPAEQEAAFATTAAAGLRYLRMDYALGQVYPQGRVDFSAVDRVNALAAAYGVDVLGVVTTTPWYITACPGGATDHLDRCAPAPRLTVVLSRERSGCTSPASTNAAGSALVIRAMSADRPAASAAARRSSRYSMPLSCRN